MDLRSHDDHSETTTLAIEVVMDRAVLSRRAAAAALFDISVELGVDVQDLAALVVAAEHERHGDRSPARTEEAVVG